MGLEERFDTLTKVLKDPEDIENGLQDDKVGTVYREIKPEIPESTVNRENLDASSPSQNVKLPPPSKQSTSCNQTLPIDQAHCDTEELHDVSWIQQLSAKHNTTKGTTSKESAPAFVKSISRLEFTEPWLQKRGKQLEKCSIVAISIRQL